jgi:hypothetical protein
MSVSRNLIEWLREDNHLEYTQAHSQSVSMTELHVFPIYLLNVSFRQSINLPKYQYIFTVTVLQIWVLNLLQRCDMKLQTLQKYIYSTKWYSKLLNTIYIKTSAALHFSCWWPSFFHFALTHSLTHEFRFFVSWVNFIFVYFSCFLLTPSTYIISPCCMFRVKLSIMGDSLNFASLDFVFQYIYRHLKHVHSWHWCVFVLCKCVTLNIHNKSDCVLECIWGSLKPWKTSAVI